MTQDPMPSVQRAGPKTRFPYSTLDATCVPSAEIPIVWVHCHSSGVRYSSPVASLQRKAFP